MNLTARFKWWTCGLVSAVAGTLACNLSPVEVPVLGRTVTGDMVYQDRVRTYRVYIPTGADTVPSPLVFVYHGGGGTAIGMQESTRFDQAARTAGMLVVYPDATSDWAEGCDGCSQADREGIDDVGFTLALRDTVDAHWLVDESRVYAAGYSQGGFMAYHIGCVAAAHFAGIGPVMATMSVPLAETCSPSADLRFVMIVGTEDPVIPFEGRPDDGVYSLLSADSTLGLWAGFNGCTGDLVTQYEPEIVADPWMVRREEYPSCAPGSGARMYAVEGAGHVWPLGDIDPARAIVDFFLGR